MSISCSPPACAALYVRRASELALKLGRARPLPADLEYQLAYQSPHNLALELSKSILYENADSIDKTIKSITQDSLWNGKPQQYFESMNYAEKDYDSDSLA